MLLAAGQIEFGDELLGRGGQPLLKGGVVSVVEQSRMPATLSGC